MKPVVAVDQVTKNFDLEQRRLKTNWNNWSKPLVQRTAINKMSLTVNRGEKIGISGPNGSGKSTLLRLIAGIYPPTQGKIMTQGRIAAVIELGAGFNFELTGLENIYLYSTLLGTPREILDKNLKKLIDFSGLSHDLNLPLKKYSSGMKARLAFSIVAFSQADILIFDEVFAVGDREFVDKSFNLLKKLSETSTIILSSHNFSLLYHFCDQVVTIEEGQTQDDTHIIELLLDLPTNSEFVTTVISDSMKPYFSKGDQIKIKKIPYQKLKVGDVILIYLEKVNLLIAHRLQFKIKDEKRQAFYTKGDNSPLTDSWQITPENYVGKVIKVVS